MRRLTRFRVKAADFIEKWLRGFAADLALRLSEPAEAGAALRKADSLDPSHPGLKSPRDKAVRLEANLTEP